MGRAPRLCFLLFEGTCLDGVFVEHMLNDSVRWTMEPAWIIGHGPLLGAFRPVVRVNRYADNFVRLQRDGDNDAGADIGTAPAFAAAPELKADVEVVALHW